MTIHAAKGLEFPVVCVADLGRAGRGDDEALRVTDDGRVGLSIASIGGGSSAGMALDTIKEDQARLADEEERRVFYVAMTRAREHLVLSGAAKVDGWPPARRLGPPIDWIWRALAPDLPELGHEGESVRETPDGREARVRCRVYSPAAIDPALEWEVEPVRQRERLGRRSRAAAAARGRRGRRCAAGRAPQLLEPRELPALRLPLLPRARGAAAAGDGQARRRRGRARARDPQRAGARLGGARAARALRLRPPGPAERRGGGRAAGGPWRQLRGGRPGGHP